MKKITTILLIVCVFCNSQSMLFGLLQQINHYQHRFQTNDQIVELFVPFAAFQNNEITFIHKDEIEWKGNKYDIKKIEFVKNGYNAIAILDKKEAELQKDIDEHHKNKTENNNNNYQLLFFQAIPTFTFIKNILFADSYYFDYPEKILNQVSLVLTPPPLS